MSQSFDLHASVRTYYGSVLASSADLKTNACCPIDAIPERLRTIIEEIDPEVLQRFYGCGSPVPEALEGSRVLDLGCGTGRDSFVCSKLVGESGEVIGVDMTAEQLDVARRNADGQARRFGHSRSNVTFLHGIMEDLSCLGIEDGTVDVVISNCVINLAPHKQRVFSEILRVLKPGGELHFADVFADRRIPERLIEDDELVGECLAGAMYLEDFRRLLASLGVPDFRVMTSRPITLENPNIEAKVGMVGFSSMTVRAFKLDSLEDRCEDYGQIAIYRGTLDEAPHAFRLDDHHLFPTRKPVPVCGNTAAMLSETRFAPDFELIGDRSTHLGLFDCGDRPSADSGLAANGACC